MSQYIFCPSPADSQPVMTPTNIEVVLHEIHATAVFHASATKQVLLASVSDYVLLFFLQEQ